MRKPARVSSVICVVDDPVLRAAVERVAAAAGVRLVTLSAPARKHWIAAAAIVVDESGARRCAESDPPRRESVLLVTSSQPRSSAWAAAVAVGAHDVCALPEGEDALLRHLTEAGERGSSTVHPGRLIAVIAGRGGAGASVFAAALSQSRPTAEICGDRLLVDLDPCSGGLDLLFGAERTPGLRWPDICSDRGRLNWPALRAALPRARGVHLLSSGRVHHEIDAGVASAVLDCGRRGGVRVVCDVPRQATAAVPCALHSADLVVVVTTCDVRSLAATAALAARVRTLNPNLGLVVRGPAPGGLRAADAVEATAVPLLATVRHEPLLPAQLEQGGLGLRRRSPLAAAAAKVMGLLDQGAGVAVA